MQLLIDWLFSLEWERLLPELIGKALGFLTGFAASWFLLFRRRLNDIARLQSGDSDDFIFQMHSLWPVAGEDLKRADTDKFVLLFRNIAPKTTLNDLYDNLAIRDVVKKLAAKTSLSDPILKTEGSLGFELLNDALGHIAGLLAPTPMDRETWLFAMTCEDRQFVRKNCIRCFLIKPGDLQRFHDWDWCRDNVLVEKPWHWFRVVALHRIACCWMEEQRLADQEANLAHDKEMPLVDRQVRHDRVRLLSIGINSSEQPVGKPHTIDWSVHLPEIQKMGLPLAIASAKPEHGGEQPKSQS